MATTRTEDVRKVMNTAMEQVRTSLLAALGAGSLAGRAVADAVSKARTRVTSSSEAAKKNVEDLPSELEQLRDRFDPAELRKLLDEYAESATKLYRKLVSSGEQTWERTLEPQVKRGIEQLEEALRTAQERVDGVTSDARERVDAMVAMLTRRAREAERTVDSTVVGESSEDKPGPVKTDATRTSVKTRKDRPSGERAAEGTQPVTQKAASARKKAVKPSTSTTARASRTRRTTGSESADSPIDES
ncbi:hypothetical protein [Saccharomonospora glauca]|jgi:heparin binding hemagglutinin HbhA|uniref:Heparin binding hemagglutinin HbhA n=1 Tax=Saccharomonospora glauca K62 TaxID=928724 RepID=I1CX25_9PSEU|nr:hypothetical protein [Saccharomonospora glauca]EIE97249.1 hypothetical protein SacglDRAFT_00293 [Saccharomonospora glauca K62]